MYATLGLFSGKDVCKNYRDLTLRCICKQSKCKWRTRILQFTMENMLGCMDNEKISWDATFNISEEEKELFGQQRVGTSYIVHSCLVISASSTLFVFFSGFA